MIHGPKCRCQACVVARIWLAVPSDEHPPCCVCPLCADARGLVRSMDARDTTFTNSTHPLYPPRNHSVRFFMSNAEREQMIRALKSYLNEPIYKIDLRPAHGGSPRAERVPSAASQAWSLLRSLGMRFRAGDPR